MMLTTEAVIADKPKKEKSGGGGGGGGMGGMGGMGGWEAWRDGWRRLRYGLIEAHFISQQYLGRATRPCGSPARPRRFLTSQIVAR